jgi:hypothetical protein
MADSYEYPPALANYQPLQYERKGLFPISLKLRHRFFLTRAKFVLTEMLAGDYSERGEEFLEYEIVLIMPY